MRTWAYLSLESRWSVSIVFAHVTHSYVYSLRSRMSLSLRVITSKLCLWSLSLVQNLWVKEWGIATPRISIARMKLHTLRRSISSFSFIILTSGDRCSAGSCLQWNDPWAAVHDKLSWYLHWLIVLQHKWSGYLHSNVSCESLQWSHDLQVSGLLLDDTFFSMCYGNVSA